MPLSADEIEQIQRLVVKPVIDDNRDLKAWASQQFTDIREIFRDHTKEDETMLANHEGRIARVERNQSRAMTVYGLIVGALTIAFNIFVEKIKKWLKL